MKQVLKYVWYLFLIFLAGFLVWRFSFMIVWVVIAAVISAVGHPMVRFFDRIRILRWHLPHALSTGLSLFLIVAMFFGLLAVFVPMIVNQAETIARIDVNRLAQNLQGPLQWLENEMHYLGVMPYQQSLQDFIIIKAKTVVNLGSVGLVINSFFNVAGNFFLGLFSILFIAFFFLKDEHLFEESLLLIIPVRYHADTREVMATSRYLLMRYFVGLIVELLGVMSIISISLWILGVENALLIGFFGGIMNIIPYLGPMIGSVIGITLGVTATLASGTYDLLLPVLLKLTGVFFVANFIDNNILVPLIYSNSVKAHPLEIFFVIIMGGSLAGILGMLLAIPVYTVLRVIARQFLQRFRIVQKLTETI